MKYAEIVGLGLELLKIMSKYDGTINDWRHLPLYNDFVVMRNNRVKHRAVIEDLATKYNLSQSSVERIIRRFRKEIKDAKN